MQCERPEIGRRARTNRLAAERHFGRNRRFQAVVRTTGTQYPEYPYGKIMHLPEVFRGSSEVSRAFTLALLWRRYAPRQAMLRPPLLMTSRMPR